MTFSPQRRALLQLGLSLSWPAAAGPGRVCGVPGTPAAVSFPSADPARDPRRVYPLELLTLALRKAGCGLPVEPRQDYAQGRAMAELALGRLDLTMVSHRQLPRVRGQVVPVPLRRGLLGLRLLLCLPDRVDELARVQDAGQLKGLALGYGADWNDRPVFEQLGYRLVTTSSYAGLFSMLRARRFDYLSRGLNEVWDELALARRRGSAIAVVPGLALRYPLDDYFVVRPDAPELASLIEQGLVLAQKDGSFQSLFEQRFGAALRQADLRARRLLAVAGYPDDELVQREQDQLLRKIHALPTRRAG